MNDLAEKALHGLDVARREIAARPVAALSVGGFVLAAVIVVTGGRIGPAPATVPLDRWLNLVPEADYRITGVGMGVVMIATIGGLLGLWLLTLRVSRLRRFRERDVWTIAGAWAVPFIVGPPLLSTDIYRYVAQGLIARRGLSPYHRGADELGPMRLVDVIDPNWRSAHSTDGPVAILVDHVAISVSGGSVISAVIVFRVVAVLSVIVIGRLAADLAGPARTTALCLTVLNPAVLLYVISAAHITGLIAALLLAALLAASQRRWWRAVILACVAAGLRAVALLAVPAIIAIHALGYPTPLKLRVALRDSAVAVVTLAAAVFCVPFGLGWIDNLSSATHAHTPFAPASLLGDLVGLIVTFASYDDLAAGGRIAAGVAGVTVIVYLYLTVRTRPLERTIAYALLAAGILAPVVYPSYLLVGVLCLAPTATGVRRDWVIALSCAACVLTPVGLGERGGQYAAAIGLAAIAVVLGPRLYVRYRNAVLAGSRVSAGG
jgi:alpha-1,6-mannosyltransferase